MFGTISDEKEVNVPAIEAWKVYGTLQLAKIVSQSLPHLFSKIVTHGDGGVGTIVEIFFPPGSPGPISYKEKFTVVDDSRLVKETEVVEGGYLDLGFDYFRVRFQIIQKEDKDWCVVKSTIEYQIKDEAAANASIVSIQPLTTIMEVVADYLLKHYVK